MKSDHCAGATSKVMTYSRVRFDVIIESTEHDEGASHGTEHEPLSRKALVELLCVQVSPLVCDRLYHACSGTEEDEKTTSPGFGLVQALAQRAEDAPVETDDAGMASS